MNNSASSDNPNQTGNFVSGVLTSEKNLLWGYKSGTVNTEATQHDLQAPIGDSISTADFTIISPGLMETLSYCKELLKLRIDWNKDLKEHITSICNLTIPGNGAKVLSIIKNISNNAICTEEGWKNYAIHVKNSGYAFDSKTGYKAYFLENVFLNFINDDIGTLQTMCSLIESALTKKSKNELHTVIFEASIHAEHHRLNKNKNLPEDWDEGVIFKQITDLIFNTLPADYRKNFETYISFKKFLNGSNYQVSLSLSEKFQDDFNQIRYDFFQVHLDISQDAVYRPENDPNHKLLDKAMEYYLEILSLINELHVPKENSIKKSTDAYYQIAKFSRLYTLFLDLKHIVSIQIPSFVFKSELIEKKEQKLVKKQKEKIEQETEQEPIVAKKKKKNKKKKHSLAGEGTNVSEAVTKQTQDFDEEEEQVLHTNDDPLTTAQTQEPNISTQPATETIPLKESDDKTEYTIDQPSQRLQLLRLEGEQSRNKNRQERNAAIVEADKQMRQVKIHDRAIQPLIDIDIAKAHLDKLEDLFNVNTEKIKYSTVETLFASLGITRLNQRGSHITMSFFGHAVGYFETIEDEDKSDAIAKFTVVKPHGKTKTQAVMNNNLMSLRRSIKNILPLEIQQELHITGDSLVTNSGTKKNTFKL